MRRVLASAAVLLCVVLSDKLPAQTRKVRADINTTLQQKILDLEKKRIAAMVSKNIAVLDSLLGDDLSYTHSAGSTDTKASFLALIKDRGRYLGIDYSNTEVIPWSGNTVVVRGRAEIRLEDTPPYGVLFMDVWALRDGAWKMVAWQATRIPQ